MILAPSPVHWPGLGLRLALTRRPAAPECQPERSRGRVVRVRLQRCYSGTVRPGLLHRSPRKVHVPTLERSGGSRRPAAAAPSSNSSVRPVVFRRSEGRRSWHYDAQQLPPGSIRPDVSESARSASRQLVCTPYFAVLISLCSLRAGRSGRQRLWSYPQGFAARPSAAPIMSPGGRSLHGTIEHACISTHVPSEHVPAMELKHANSVLW
jgi:hypothetical protein